MSSHERRASSSLHAFIVAALSKAEKAVSSARTLSYPIQILYLVASVVALVALSHLISIFYNFIARKRVYDWNRRTAVSLSRVPAAVIDSSRALAFRWTVPIGSSHELNLAEVGVTLGYMAALLSWTFVNTTSFRGIKVEPHYYGNRAGYIAASQLPIMVALGMRNNIISWLTGISYTKLNFLHRMSARVLCVIIWIHATGRLIIGLRGDTSIVYLWLQAGFVAGTSLALLCFLSIRPIRQRNYEAFLIVHFIFAFIFVLGTYFHLNALDLLYYGALPSMVLWGFDHFIRLVRLAMVNFGYLNPWSSKSSKQEMDAIVEVLSPDVLRVTLHRSKHFHWRPGHSVYLSIPSISTLPFESHPFTISTIEDDSTSTDSMLIFLLRVRRGFTQKLLRAATSSDQTHKLFLNGPYGSPPLLLGYQTVILIAGGSGVAFTLPFFLDIMRRARDGKDSCQKILFIWAIHDIDHIHWIANILAPALENVPASISIAIQLYITSSTTEEVQKWDDSPEKDKESEVIVHDSHSSTSRSYSTILQSPFVEALQGRPDFKLLVSREVVEATGRIAINVCGPHSLVNDARAAIRSPRPMDILRGGPTITLHIETFGG